MLEQNDFNLPQLLEDLCAGRSLTAETAERVFNTVFEGKLDAAQLSALLIALRIKGETPDEIEGAARAMVSAATRFHRPDGFEIGEIVGTGGDGAQTINISTTAALAGAGLGLHIAKHGNRGVSSLSGASDMLAALGVEVRPSPQEAGQLLTQTGFCFCFAPIYHPAMRFAGPVRASLKVRTLFNVLGPLTNPVHPDYALIGVYDPALLSTVARSLHGLGVKRAFVVHGSGLDEVAVHGPTQVVRLSEDGGLEAFTLSPQDFGVTAPVTLNDIRGSDPAANAGTTEAILSGRGTPAQQAVVAANLAMLLLAAGRATRLADAVALAREGLRSGAGLKPLAAHRAFARAKRRAVNSVAGLAA